MIKRFIQHRCTEMTEVSSGDYVLHSDYVVLVSKAFELAKRVNEKCAQLKIAVDALSEIYADGSYEDIASEIATKALKELRGDR